MMVVVGAAFYLGAVAQITAMVVSMIREGEVARREVQRLIFPAYVAGGVLFVAGAAFNPVGPSLVLMSGVSSGFGGMAGLAIVPRLVEGRTIEAASTPAPLRFSPGWIVAGALVALGFVAVLGPGVRLS
jgi:hypothetical protein